MCEILHSQADESLSSQIASLKFELIVVITVALNRAVWYYCSLLCCRPTSEGLVIDALTTAHSHHHFPLPHDGPLRSEAYEEPSSI